MEGIQFYWISFDCFELFDAYSWQVIFLENKSVILALLSLMGLGQAMIYYKEYLVPTYSHMIQASNEDGYSKNDVLVDSLSGLSFMKS